MADIDIDDKSRFELFWLEWSMVPRFALTCLFPGRPVPSFIVDQNEATPLRQESDAELNLIIQQGRLQLDRQAADLARIRSHAQWLITTFLILPPLIFGRHAVTNPSESELGIGGFLGLGLVLLGLLALAGIIFGQAILNQIHTARLTSHSGTLRVDLAASYARLVSTGENTVATRLTAVRNAFIVLLFGTSLMYWSLWL